MIFRFREVQVRVPTDCHIVGVCRPFPLADRSQFEVTAVCVRSHDCETMGIAWLVRLGKGKCDDRRLVARNIGHC